MPLARTVHSASNFDKKETPARSGDQAGVDKSVYTLFFLLLCFVSFQ